MGGLSSELLLALSKKLNSGCFATLSANITGAGFAACLFCWRDIMDNIKFYEINEAYIDYLSPHAPHLFHNSKKSQTNTRKYLGVVLRVNDMDYFAPLSSHKAKHDKMKESLDFLKVGRYAVINLNNMFPVPEKECHYVDFSVIKDKVYKDLLLAEYRIVKQMQGKIGKRAEQLYHHKCVNGDNTALARRCNDFIKLEKLCLNYKQGKKN